MFISRSIGKRGKRNGSERSPRRGADITFVGGVLVVSEAALGARPHLVDRDDPGLPVHREDGARLAGRRRHRRLRSLLLLQSSRILSFSERNFPGF